MPWALQRLLPLLLGLGRAAKNGILFRNAKSLELFKNITTVVFDKTGTLTKGQFKISNIESTGIDKEILNGLFFLWRNIPIIPLQKQ